MPVSVLQIMSKMDETTVTETVVLTETIVLIVNQSFIQNEWQI